ncbi:MULTISPECIES: hypothetical protein [unclassified Variovorax]|uniref:hypothetical protein n=2 Tax=Variovorax TaxID=34072 RepID=UPI000A48BB51|nr:MULTISPECIES: hypothetical protein [unclassified Variovorax]PNG53368.1 hypothetical protein CHC06_04715 [Variovorax sp. B2]PNG53941.1 hypothetical protein CHC07_03763 [Variovorax sp. B4]VTV11410.1 hypothetical protein WDL1CHR_02277 [Variovorax sp. WDL1]
MRIAPKVEFALSTVRWALGTVLIASLAACGGDSGNSGSSNYTAPAGAPTAAGLTTGGVGAASVPAASSAPASAAPISAPGAPPPPSMPVPGVATPPALREQIAALERSGAYPALDRSSDVAGPDANRNGVRDDIEAWINAQPITDLQRKALMQSARALQRTLILDVKDKTALQKSGEEILASTNCGDSVFSPYAIFSHLLGKIEAMTANTRERAVRYMQYNAASSGSSTTLPNGNTCEP